jgi:hypothetical protein
MPQQQRQRVGPGSKITDLKMQVRSAAVAGGSNAANGLALRHYDTCNDQYFAQVRVQGQVVDVVVNHNKTPVSLVVPPSPYDNTPVCGDH